MRNQYYQSLKPLSLGLGLGLLIMSSANAATVISATRTSLDTIVGRAQGTSTTAYNADTNTQSQVGSTGGTPNRRSQNILYGYTLPTLTSGQTIESFTFTFEVNRYRDHQTASDFQLDVYLLDVADPTSTGIIHYYDSSSLDPTDAAYIGQYSNGVNGAVDDITGLTDEVTFTVNSGPAFTLLQSFYTGLTPDHEAYFRFNMNGWNNFDLDRVEINDDVSTSSLDITVIPEPSTTVLLGLGGLALMLRRRR